MIKVDLNKAYLSRVHGDMTEVLTWVNDERSLILWPTHYSRRGWYIIGESVAWTYCERDITVMPKLEAIADRLGFEVTRARMLKIERIIQDSIPDLVRMPSSQTEYLVDRAVGRLQVRAAGELLHEEDITLEKTQGVVYG